MVGVLVLVYKVLAFGAQPVLGLLVDRLRRPRLAVLLSLAMMAGALVAMQAAPVLAVGMAGLASGVFHVGGGALALCATKDQATGPGLFAAPGVVGLAIGGAMAVGGYVVVWPFVLLLAMLSGAVWRHAAPTLPYRTRAERPAEPLFEAHDLIMLALLAAFALRSAVWTALQYVLHGEVLVLVALALAAGVGKALGGFFADRLGWRRWATGALLVATPLLLLAALGVWWSLGALRRPACGPSDGRALPAGETAMRRRK